EARRDIHLVQHVGIVGRDDGHAEHLAKPGGKNEQPYQRTHERGDEALALMQEAQCLAPHDALETDRIALQREPGGGADGFRRHAAAPAAGAAAPLSTSAVKAARMSGAAVMARMRATGPCARMRPWCSTMTLSSAATSSMRWVAHSAHTRSSPTSLRTWSRMSARERMSRPTVGSSSNISFGSCSS